MKKEFPDKWEHLNKKLADPYEYFNSIDDHKKPVDKVEKNFFSKLKNGCPSDEKIERTREIIKVLNIRHGEELTELYLKRDVISLADIFEKLIQVPIKEFDINPLYCVSLPGFTWQCGLKYTDIKLENFKIRI